MEPVGDGEAEENDDEDDLDGADRPLLDADHEEDLWGVEGTVD